MQTLLPCQRFAYVIALSLLVSGCAGAERRSADAGRDARTGTIEGDIQHPAHVIPSMRICAIGSGE